MKLRLIGGLAMSMVLAVPPSVYAFCIFWCGDDCQGWLCF